jgi:hypothetical protein
MQQSKFELSQPDLHAFWMDKTPLNVHLRSALHDRLANYAEEKDYIDLSKFNRRT